MLCRTILGALLLAATAAAWHPQPDVIRHQSRYQPVRVAPLPQCGVVSGVKGVAGRIRSMVTSPFKKQPNVVALPVVAAPELAAKTAVWSPKPEAKTAAASPEPGPVPVEPVALPEMAAKTAAEKSAALNQAMLEAKMIQIVEHAAATRRRQVGPPTASEIEAFCVDAEVGCSVDTMDALMAEASRLREERRRAPFGPEIRWEYCAEEDYCAGDPE